MEQHIIEAEQKQNKTEQTNRHTNRLGLGGVVNKKTQRSLRETVEFLKARRREETALTRQVRNDRFVRTPEIEPKRYSKVTKRTKYTPLSYGYNAGTWSGVKGVANLIKATTSTEGTRAATEDELQRLRYSAQNSHTTRGSYY